MASNMIVESISQGRGKLGQGWGRGPDKNVAKIKENTFSSIHYPFLKIEKQREHPQ